MKTETPPLYTVSIQTRCCGTQKYRQVRPVDFTGTHLWQTELAGHSLQKAHTCIYI